jgi:hypothetical protein
MKKYLVVREQKRLNTAAIQPDFFNTVFARLIYFMGC